MLQHQLTAANYRHAAGSVSTRGCCSCCCKAVGLEAQGATAITAAAVAAASCCRCHEQLVVVYKHRSAGGQPQKALQLCFI